MSTEIRSVVATPDLSIGHQPTAHVLWSDAGEVRCNQRAVRLHVQATVFALHAGTFTTRNLIHVRTGLGDQDVYDFAPFPLPWRSTTQGEVWMVAPNRAPDAVRAGIKAFDETMRDAEAYVRTLVANLPADAAALEHHDFAAQVALAEQKAWFELDALRKNRAEGDA